MEQNFHGRDFPPGDVLDGSAGVTRKVNDEAWSELQTGWLEDERAALTVEPEPAIESASVRSES
jgi:hypothetical protein